jgi:hypothetical protein
MVPKPATPHREPKEPKPYHSASRPQAVCAAMRTCTVLSARAGSAGGRANVAAGRNREQGVDVTQPAKEPTKGFFGQYQTALTCVSS